MRRSPAVVSCSIVIGQFCERTRLISPLATCCNLVKFTVAFSSKSRSEANPSCLTLVAAILAVPRAVAIRALFADRTHSSSEKGVVPLTLEL